MRRLLSLAALLIFIFADAASAQEVPRVELFGAFSYANGSFGGGRRNLNGWNASATINLNRWFGVEGDFGGLYGGGFTQTIPITECPTPSCQPATISFDQYVHTFLGGPRFSYRRERITLFTHVLLGGGRLSATTEFSNIVLPPGFPSRFSSSDSNFVLALGGGVDHAFGRNLAWRVQADYLQTRFSGGRQDNLRVSTGVVFRFGR